jgi:hypothetical protein
MQTGISVMQSPYAYGDHQYPRMHTGIELNSHMRTGIGVIQSLYAYRDLQDPSCNPRMHTGIEINPRMHTGILMITVCIGGIL